MPTPETTFCFPIKRLENSCLILEPFDLSAHAESFFQGSKDHPELFPYIDFGPFSSTADFEAWYQSNIVTSDTVTLFAILAKSDTSDSHTEFAGITSLLSASVANASIEIGVCSLLILKAPSAANRQRPGHHSPSLSTHIRYQQRRRAFTSLRARPPARRSRPATLPVAIERRE